MKNCIHRYYHLVNFLTKSKYVKNNLLTVSRCNIGKTQQKLNSSKQKADKKNNYSLFHSLFTMNCKNISIVHKLKERQRRGHKVAVYDFEGKWLENFFTYISYE